MFGRHAPQRRLRSIPGSLRMFAPLVALAAVAVTALVCAAQAGLAFCDRRVDVAMPDMPGMSMGSGAAGIMICPVVLVLIAASVVLAAVAIVLITRDPQRAVTLRAALRCIARLPPKRTAGSLAALTLCAIAAMVAVDGNGPPPIALCAALLALVVVAASAAAALSLGSARAILAFTTRLYHAIVACVARCRRQSVLVFARSPRPVVATIPVIARSRGLRAPPTSLR
jgi:hypothetical protein